MIKKILLLITICSIISCGYQPLYIKKDNLDKPINIISFEGNKKINKKIISYLNIKENKNKDDGYKLTLISEKKLEIISKDKNGNASVYRSSLIVDFILYDKEKIVKQKKFNSSFTYNNSENKFELSQYKKIIETNLINEISEKIFIFLRS